MKKEIHILNFHIYRESPIFLSFHDLRKIDDDQGRVHELGQAAVKSMRGVLQCWIRQADKVRHHTAHMELVTI